MILASHGLIASSISGVDADWLAYYNRVIAAGGSLTTTEQNATKQLVADLKANSLWTPMKAIYPMVGASAAACAQNLKSSSFTGTFTSGWTFASTGVTPNGTSAYMDTGIVPNTEFATSNDGNYGYYHRTTLKTASFVMGTSGPYFGDYSNNSVSCYPSINDGNNALLTVSQTTLGFRQLSRDTSNANIINYRLNNTNNTATQSSTGKSALSIKLGAVIPTYFSNVELAFAYIGNTKLTTTEMSNYFSAVNTFQTTLSRQV
jgi:hypothetical protein